eukprot:COSAG01_NODE_1798_length_9184_cov_6.067860_5_plen_88_part_00
MAPEMRHRKRAGLAWQHVQLEPFPPRSGALVPATLTGEPLSVTHYVYAGRGAACKLPPTHMLVTTPTYQYSTRRECFARAPCASMRL